jgi:hypothetical protein
MVLQERENNDYRLKCNKESINYLRKDFANWSSGNDRIDHFIQEKQIEINYLWDRVFEWIPYNQFLDINKVDEDNFSTTHSAKWKDGHLYWIDNNYIRKPGEEVALKCSHNGKNIDKFLNMV